MKTEDHAWRELQRHAAAHLRPEFAERVLRASHGPTAEAWQQLRAHGAAQLRTGFAERVLRAARNFPGVPSLLDQVALSAATAALCLLGVMFVHAHNTQLEEQRNLDGWHQLAAEVRDLQEFDNGQ